LQTLVTQGRFLKYSREVLLSPADVLQQGKLAAINSLSLKDKKATPVGASQSLMWRNIHGKILKCGEEET